VESILRGDASDVSRIADDARREKERVAATQRKGHPVVELNRYVASNDGADFGTRVAVAPGGDLPGDFGEGQD
jgi:hypothetical protein